MGTTMKSSTSGLTKPTGFCLSRTDPVRKQVPINSTQYSECSGSFSKGLSSDANLCHKCWDKHKCWDIHKLLLKKPWFSLKMIGRGFICCCADSG